METATRSERAGTVTPTDYLDETHAEALVYVETLRRHTRAVQCEIDRWEPAPCPTDWGHHER